MPTPQPSAVTRSDSSLFSSTLAVDAPSVLSTLPRSGRIAWRARSRPCLAEPPAESPSTTNSSLVDRSRSWCSRRACPAASTRPTVGPLADDFGLRRAAGLAGARRQDDARDDALRQSSWLLFSQCSSAGRTKPSTALVTSGLFRRSLVCPWNCGSSMKIESTPVMPSRMSSAVSVTPFGDRLCVSMKLRTALPRPARRPFSCVPPEAGGNAVDVAAQVLVGGLGPLQHELERGPPFSLRQRERRLVHRLRVAAPRGSSSGSRRCPRRAGTPVLRLRRSASSSNVTLTPLCR